MPLWHQLVAMYFLAMRFLKKEKEREKDYTKIGNTVDFLHALIIIYLQVLIINLKWLKLQFQKRILSKIFYFITFFV